MKYLLRILVVTLFFGFISCDKDGEEPGEYGNKYLEKQLFNTSWKLKSSITYKYDNNGDVISVKDNTIPLHSNEISDYRKYLESVFTFSSEKNGDNGYIFYLSSVPGIGKWWIGEEDNLTMIDAFYIGGNPGNISGEDRGLMSRFLPSVATKIESISDGELFLSRESEEYNLKDEWILTRVYDYEPGSGSGSGTGTGTSYETPDIGLEDFTCYSTSITMKYRIYNQDEAKVTSAKGYYGTSTPSRSVSADIAGSLITIRFTGLSKNTTYYFKCSATGRGGTTTSETTKLQTTN